MALVEPDGATIASEIAPSYPEQFADISYGIRMGKVETTLVSADSQIELLIPQDNRYGLDWRSPNFVPGDDWVTEIDQQRHSQQ